MSIQLAPRTSMLVKIRIHQFFGWNSLLWVMNASAKTSKSSHRRGTFSFVDCFPCCRFSKTRNNTQQKKYHARHTGTGSNANKNTTSFQNRLTAHSFLLWSFEYITKNAFIAGGSPFDTGQAVNSSEVFVRRNVLLGSLVGWRDPFSLNLQFLFVRV